MTLSSGQEKEREKREKDKESKEKDKKTTNGHLFTSGPSDHAAHCSQCNKTFTSKDAFHCTCKNRWFSKNSTSYLNKLQFLGLSEKTDRSSKTTFQRLSDSHY